MKVDLRAEPTFQDMLHIARHLRERDREELFATRYGADPAQLAQDTLRTGGFRWAAYLDGEPVAALGAYPRWPNVWSAWAFGTDKWPHAAITLTRHVRRFMLPALYRSGAIRVDAMALASHTDARAWLEYLGAEPEKELAKWGKNGETFVSYVWTRERTKALIGL